MHCIFKAITCVLVLYSSLHSGPYKPELSELIDYHNPDEVKLAVKSIMKKSNMDDSELKILYSPGVGHYDGFIPTSIDLSEIYKINNHNKKFIYQHGRIVEVFNLKKDGKSEDAIWYNKKGLPVLNHRSGSSYILGIYDEKNRIKEVYTFSTKFKLLHYQLFEYKLNELCKRMYKANKDIMHTIIYANNAVYLLQDGERKRINTGSRQTYFDMPKRFGLKPIYYTATKRAIKPMFTGEGKVNQNPKIVDESCDLCLETVKCVLCSEKKK